MLRTRRRLLPALLLALGLAGTAWGRMDDPTFRKTASGAKRVMGKAGRLDEKLPLLRLLAKDDTRRATEVVFAWNRASHALVVKKLAPEVEKRRTDLDKVEAKLEKKHGPGWSEEQTLWSDAEKKRHGKRLRAWNEAKDEIDVELRVQRYLASAVDRLTAADALGWLAKEGVPGLIADRASGALLEACFGRLLDSPPTRVQNAVLGILQQPLSPEAAIKGLRWVGKHKPENAALRLERCVTSRSPAVKRMAVKVLATLDDRRSVPLLIAGLQDTTGLPAAEIETLLQRFTGKRFSQDYPAWKRWWSTEGEAWLAELDAAKRFDPLAMSGGVSFYGIRTPSKRIAFLLDRSGSMKAPAVHNSENVPFTSEDGKETSAGKTRLEVAKIQLARTINNLASDAFFTILFYNASVTTWDPAPQIVRATRENKAKAQKWFMPLEPAASTSLFDGMLKALEYAEKVTLQEKAKEPEGVGSERIDTIFLLSDGAPTHFRDEPLGDPYAREKAAASESRANGARAYAESEKAKAESAKALAANAKEKAERARVPAEAARAKAEAALTDSDKQRLEDEAQRHEQEQARYEAEMRRYEGEAQSHAKEQARYEAEAELHQAEKEALEAKADRYELAVEMAYRAFKQANDARGIVVHAIGVGQAHNVTLMKRIARESGGKYVAVGMD